MIELIQFPHSPFCIVQRRILEFSRTRFKVTNVPNGDRTLVWKASKQRYYQVPLLKDGKTVVFETSDESQVIAKYIDQKLELGLFPRQWAGIQNILWRYIESDVEGIGFKLNDIYYEEHTPKNDQWRFVRHKERKFGQGCIDQWRRDQKHLIEQLTQKLLPFEQMLASRDFLIDDRPRFVDFDLYGMLGNFLYSGHYSLPKRLNKIRSWYPKMAKIKRPR